MQYKLVTSEESDVATGKISTTSPIGRALLNKKVGDEVIVDSPNGKRELEILKLSTIHDEIADTPKGRRVMAPSRVNDECPISRASS